MSNSTIEDRLKSVIGSLEFSQTKDYDSIKTLVLSYLYDILNDTVPEYVLKISQHRKTQRLANK